MHSRRKSQSSRRPDVAFHRNAIAHSCRHAEHPNDIAVQHGNGRAIAGKKFVGDYFRDDAIATASHSLRWRYDPLDLHSATRRRGGETARKAQSIGEGFAGTHFVCGGARHLSADAKPRTLDSHDYSIGVVEPS